MILLLLLLLLCAGHHAEKISNALFWKPAQYLNLMAMEPIDRTNYLIENYIKPTHFHEEHEFEADEIG
jgi:hypothetical protein